MTKSKDTKQTAGESSPKARQFDARPGKSPLRDSFFNKRGMLDLSRDTSSHRRYAYLFDDLLA